MLSLHPTQCCLCPSHADALMSCHHPTISVMGSFAWQQSDSIMLAVPYSSSWLMVFYVRTESTPITGTSLISISLFLQCIVMVNQTSLSGAYHLRSHSAVHLSPTCLPFRPQNHLFRLLLSEPYHAFEGFCNSQMPHVLFLNIRICSLKWSFRLLVDFAIVRVGTSF